MVSARLSCRDLATALATVKPAVRPAAPFVMLDTESAEGLTLAADNFNIQIRTRVDAWAPAKDRGTAAVPFRQLAELVGHLDGEVELVVKDQLEVRSGGTDMVLPLAESFELPRRPEPEGELVEIDVVDWASVWRVAGHCLGDDSRPILQSVFFEPDAIAATDGFRMAVFDYETGLDSLIPVGMIGKVTDDELDSVGVIADGRAVKITMGNTTSWGSPTQGEAPKWRLLVPEKTEYSITMEAERFLEAITRVQITARELAAVGRAVLATPVEEEGHPAILLASQRSMEKDLGECSEVVPLVEGELPFPLGFNARFMADAIKVMDQDKVTIELQENERKPMVLSHAGFKIVLMPVADVR